MARNRLSSVGNAARLLRMFTARTPTWGVSELAEATGQSTSTVHRVLATLTDEGLLQQDPDDGRYRLGLAMFDIIAAVPTQRSLHEAVLLPMTELRHRTGETVQVAVLDGRHVVYVERLDSPHSLRLFTELGRRNWAHCTSTGKVLLAALTQPALSNVLRNWDLPRVTSHTVTSTAELRQQLVDVRAKGHAVNESESEVGMVSFAAPIRDASGVCVAALSVAGPTGRIGTNHGALIEAVTYMARACSERLGHQR